LDGRRPFAFGCIRTRRGETGLEQDRLRGSSTHEFWRGPLAFSINPQPPALRCDLFFGEGFHDCQTWRLFLCQPGEPLHGLCRQIGTGGLHCPVSTQRRLALFSLAALCVWGVDPAPNDPVLRGKGRGRWRRVCSNAHFRQIIPAAIVTGVDRIRCSVTNFRFRYRLSKRHRAGGAPSPTTIPPLRFRQDARKPPVRAWQSFPRCRLVLVNFRLFGFRSYCPA
jgi:hypothetical protein